ncbi:hypothetical protein YC2023_018395 [Brassica napus]
MSWSIQRLLSAKIRCGRLELRRIKKKKKTPKSLWDNVRTDIEKVGPMMSDRQDPVWVIISLKRLNCITFIILKEEGFTFLTFLCFPSDEPDIPGFDALESLRISLFLMRIGETDTKIANPPEDPQGLTGDVQLQVLGQEDDFNCFSSRVMLSQVFHAEPSLSSLQLDGLLG